MNLKSIMERLEEHEAERKLLLRKYTRLMLSKPIEVKKPVTIHVTVDRVKIKWPQIVTPRQYPEYVKFLCDKIDNLSKEKAR